MSDYVAEQRVDVTLKDKIAISNWLKDKTLIEHDKIYNFIGMDQNDREFASNIDRISIPSPIDPIKNGIISLDEIRLAEENTDYRIPIPWFWYDGEIRRINTSDVIDEKIDSIFSSRVAYWSEGRNSWHRKWSINFHESNCIRLSTGMAKSICNYIRNQGSKFYVHEKLSVVFRSENTTIYLISLNNHSLYDIINELSRSARNTHDLIYNLEINQKYDRYAWAALKMKVSPRREDFSSKLRSYVSFPRSSAEGLGWKEIENKHIIEKSEWNRMIEKARTEIIRRNT